MKIIITLISFLFTFSALCCTCLDLGKLNKEQYNYYALIFKGQVEKIEEEKFGRTIYFRVDALYKGKIESDVFQIFSGSICGIYPKIGEPWLIFATKGENKYHTGMCTRSKNLTSKFWEGMIKKDIKFLERKLKNSK